MKNDLQHLKVKKPDGDAAVFHGSWYRGRHTRFIPDKAELQKDGAIRKHIVRGWEPEPFLTRETPIVSFGSCFARHVQLRLQQDGYRVLGHDRSEISSHIIRFGEGIVNTFSILQQFQWAIEGKSFDHLYWFGPKKEIALPGEEERAETESLLRQADVFVLTLGVSEIWYDKVTGEAFWRAIPMSIFDEERHGFRVSTVAENAANLTETHRIIKSVNPDAKVIVTLSPVPLMATFRPVSCISASTVSKAVLRVAIDEVMRADLDDLYYFPSYEIVKEYFPDPFTDDNRHPKPEIVKAVLDEFMDVFTVDEGASSEA
ncbi:MAG: GSCFA domain-containing protein [Acidobacteriota bacterium]